MRLLARASLRSALRPARSLNSGTDATQKSCACPGGVVAAVCWDTPPPEYKTNAASGDNNSSNTVIIAAGGQHLLFGNCFCIFFLFFFDDQPQCAARLAASCSAFCCAAWFGDRCPTHSATACRWCTRRDERTRAASRCSSRRPMCFERERARFDRSTTNTTRAHTTHMHTNIHSVYIRLRFVFIVQS